MNSEALLGNVATESREGFFMRSVSDFSKRGATDFRRVVEGFLRIKVSGTYNDTLRDHFAGNGS